MYRSQEVVLPTVERGIAQNHARRNQFGDSALHEFLRELRVFQLVADSHALPRSDESWQIGVERMVREARHLCLSCSSLVATMGERNTENACRRHSIFHVCFIEVATAKEQNCIWMLSFQIVELLHHRGYFFFCHISEGCMIGQR